MAAAVVQIVMPFQPLLLKIVDFLNFPSPFYSIIDRNTNNVYLRIDTAYPKIFHVFLGGQANSVEASSQKAARFTVSGLMRTYKVTVEDVTTLLRRDFLHCTAFYKAKRRELECGQGAGANTNKGKGVADELSFPVRSDVVVDFISIVASIFERIPVQASDAETACLEPHSYTALMIITTPGNIQHQKYIFGDCSPTVEGATQNLAKNVILYLLSIYRLEIIDANYSPTQSRLDSVLCILERETYLATKERVLGVKEDEQPPNIFYGEECATPKGRAYQIPAATAPPLPPKKKAYTRSEAGPSSVSDSKDSTQVFFQTPPDLEALFKCTKHT